ncbi:hypothetical protein [Pseudomonas syringae]|uniref:hypothetical protein n=1 Tax=Pseudomonas syringae TaxID=317 RepID=UPI001BCE5C3F|nr:hypothetical protein [Pseudomonas syringae]MBS7413747.1 hypothetical protein [Pseudomonas syringae]
MAKHLTPTDIQAAVDLLLGWEGQLSWELLCERLSPVVGKRPTRQSLSSHSEIKDAFVWAKSKSKEQVFRVPLPSSLKMAADRIARLEAEIDVLKKRNSMLMQRFLIWQYNASNHGLHESQLDMPLPVIDRERSDAAIKRARIVRPSTRVDKKT